MGIAAVACPGVGAVMVAAGCLTFQVVVRAAGIAELTWVGRDARPVEIPCVEDAAVRLVIARAVVRAALITADDIYQGALEWGLDSF